MNDRVQDKIKRFPMCQLRVTWKVDMAVLRLMEVLERYVLN